MQNFNFDRAINHNLSSFLNEILQFEKSLSSMDNTERKKMTLQLYDYLNQKIIVEKNYNFAFYGVLLEKYSIVSKYLSQPFILQNKSQLSKRFTLSLNELLKNKFINIVSSKESLLISKINSNDKYFDLFLDFLSCYFCFTISTFKNQSPQIFAEFIYSISASNYKGPSSNSNRIIDEENLICDRILDVLDDIYGIKNYAPKYSKGCTISPKYFLEYEIQSGYDYISMSKDLLSKI